MNPLIALSAGDFPSIAERFQAGQEVGQQNALRAALQQHGGAAMMGDQNALQALAQFDPTLAMGLRSDQQQMDLRGRADDRAERGFGLEQQRSNQSITESNQRMELARQEARMATEQHKAKMTAVEREQAMQEIQTIGAFENVGSEQDWDALADRLRLPELKGQFAQKDALVGMAQGVSEALAGPVAPEDRYREVGGRLVDLYGEGGPQTVIDQQNDPMSPIGKLAGDLQAGRITQEQFDLAIQGMAPTGMSIESDGSGGIRMVQGPGVTPVGRPLTEGQSKDNLYLTMAEGAMPGIEAFEAAMVGLGGARNAVAGAVPGGRALQSSEYQQGQVAAREFGAAILRKESGAALTAGDMEWLETRFIPTPTDKPDTVVRKREARQRAIAGLKAGMSAEQIEAVTGAITSSPDSARGSGAIPQSAVDAGVDPDLWQFMSPEDQALWN